MNYTVKQYDLLIQFIKALLVATKKKSRFACNLMETSHNRPTLPPKQVNGIRCIVDDADVIRVSDWTRSMKSAAIKDGLNMDEIDEVEKQYINYTNFK